MMTGRYFETGGVGWQQQINQVFAPVQQIDSGRPWQIDLQQKSPGRLQYCSFIPEYRQIFSSGVVGGGVGGSEVNIVDVVVGGCGSEVNIVDVDRVVVIVVVAVVVAVVAEAVVLVAVAVVVVVVVVVISPAPSITSETLAH